MWWSRSEDDILREYYSKASKEELITAFPNRTWTALVGRASVLGVRRRCIKEWTAEEDDWLRKNFVRTDDAGLTAAMERPLGQIMRRARELGFTRRNGWTSEEEALIRDYYNRGVPHELAAVLPHRTWPAIRERARASLGLRVEAAGVEKLVQ